MTSQTRRDVPFSLPAAIGTEIDVPTVRQSGWALVILMTALLALAMLALPAGNSAGQVTSPPDLQTVTIEPRGHFGGWPAALLMPPGGGNYLYLGEGSGFTIVDVSNKAQPRQVGGLPLTAQGDTNDIAVSGNTAYLTNVDGLHIVDITDCSNPRLRSSVNVQASAYGVAVAGSYAYVASGTWLRTVDVSNPISPALVGGYNFGTWVSGIQVSGTLAYVSASGLKILDISNPISPTLRGSFAEAGPVQIVGTTAYLASGGLVILNVSNPANPVLVGRYRNNDYSSDLAIVGTTAFIAGGDRGIAIVNASNPVSPTLVATTTIAGPTYALGAAGNYVYAQGQQGVTILNVSDPAHPALAGAFLRPTLPLAAVVSGSYGYMVEQRLLWALDVSNPAVPRPVMTYTLSHPNSFTGSPRMVVTGSLVLLTEDGTGMGDPTTGVELINISNPLSPTFAGFYAVPTNTKATDVAVAGQYAYISTLTGSSDGRLRIVNISNPVSPTLAGQFDTPGDARRVVVSGTVAFVADGAQGLRLINVANPASPTALSSVPPPTTTATTDAVLVLGNRAYVGSNKSGSYWLQEVNISNPASPVVLSTYSSTGTVTDLGTDGSYLFASVQGGSLHMFGLPGVIHTASLQLFSYSIHVFKWGNITCVLIIKHSWGSNWVTVSQPAATPTPTPESSATRTRTVTATPAPCSVAGLVEPPAAKAAGCSVSPGTMPCVCGVQEVTFSATACNGWLFRFWSPGQMLVCPAQGVAQTIGYFQPYITLGGGGNWVLCRSEEHRGKTVLQFSLTASVADDWQIPAITLTASGDGNDKTDISAVRLMGPGGQLGAGAYASDNGSITFNVNALVPRGQTKDFSVVYDFVKRDCESESKDYNVSISHNGNAKTYPPGVRLGSAGGSSVLTCVMDEDEEEDYDSIQEGVDGVPAGATVLVCPGTYNENVQVTRSVTVQSRAGREQTTVQAAVATKPVFAVSASSAAIDGFTIKGATGANQAGVEIGGPVPAAGNPICLAALALQDVGVYNCAIQGNAIGIFANGLQQASILSNRISANTTDGIRLYGVCSNLDIEGNSITGNQRHGIFGGDGERIYDNDITLNRENGIRIADGGSTILTNRIQNNTKNGVSIGALEAGAVVKLTDNDIGPGNKEHGVYLGQDARGVELVANRIKGNLKSGIYLDERSSAATIHQANQIENNTEAGITMRASFENTVDGNTIQGNGSGVVLREDSWGNEIKNNTIKSHASGNGIALLSCAKATEFVNKATGNTIEGNKNGVYLEASQGFQVGALGGANTIQGNDVGVSMLNVTKTSAAAAVTANTIQNNTSHGVYLKATCGVTIGRGNTIGPDNGNGVALDSCVCTPSPSNDIAGNIIQNNKKSGVYEENSRGNDVSTGNDISLNKEHGVHVKNSSAWVRDSTIKQNVKDGIHVEGVDGFVWAEGNTIGPDNQWGVYLDAVKDSRVKGNTIERNKKSGVYLSQCIGSSRIDGNTITSNPEYGIHFVESGFGSGNPRHYVSGNTIQNSRIGVFLDRSKNVTLDGGNTISGHGEAGVKLLNCPEVGENWRTRITASTIENNPYGVYVQSSSNVNIGDGNTIRVNSVAGIYLAQSKGINVSANDVGPNNQNGITVYRCSATASPNIITGNQVSYNKQHGVYVAESSGTQVGAAGASPNTAQGNVGDGIRVESSNGNQLVNNTIGPDNTHGVYLLNSRDINVELNNILKNESDGLHLENSSQVKIKSHYVTENGGAGIYLNASDDNQLSANTVTGNTGSGVVIRQSTRNQAPRQGDPANNVSENKRHGVELISANRNTLRSTIATGNELDGIHSHHSSGNEILDGINIAANKRYGIYLDGGALNQIVGPLVAAAHSDHMRAWVERNGQDGIRLDGSNSNTISYLMIAENRVGVNFVSSNQNRLHLDLLWLNGTGIKESNSSDNNYTTSRIVRQGLLWTGIHLDNSSPTMAGLDIGDNQGDGIYAENSSSPAISKSNIYGNSGNGLNNADPAVTIGARGNWWGSASGPGGVGPGSGDEISGTVDFANWRPITVSLVAIAAADPVYAARGAAAANQVYLMNWQAPTSTISVTLTDTLGWLAGPTTFTTTLAGSLPVSFTVPASAAIGTTDSVTVTVCSLADPAASDTTSFRVVASLVADLAISKESSSRSALVGQIISYTVVITNAGPDAATGVVLTDTLPVSVTLLAVTASQGTCAPQAGALVCAVGALGAGDHATITAVVRATAAGDVSSTIEALANERDPDPLNNHDAAYVAITTPVVRLFLPLIVR